MTISKNLINHNGAIVPEIKGGGGGSPKIGPNSLFSSDFMFLTTAIGEGPVYRINPNGPQDIQIQDNSIEDLIIMDNIDPNIAGTENNAIFYTSTAYGTTTQPAMLNFGTNIVSPQSFSSPVTLRKGNATAPASLVSTQETSPAAWDRLIFLFAVEQISYTDKQGDVNPYSLDVKITVYAKDFRDLYVVSNTTITGKSDKPFKREIEVVIPDNMKFDAGYVFTIEKSSDDSDSSEIADSVSALGWFEVEDTKLAYPRTAMVGYALKAVNEHTGGIPTFTSMTKGLLVKVPSNYNQPVLSGTDYPGRNGEIDWRQLELSDTGTNSYVSKGYYLQNSGTTTVRNNSTPQIYIGAWDGSFVYSWTQNPVWIIYDILTNQTYGLGIPEKNIDKFKFYQVAQYCDACDPITGNFIGVDGLADGSYRYKPRGMYSTVRENQKGLPSGTPIKERRFISDISITEQERGMDLLNKISSTFRSILIYANGKITLAVDMPNEYPAMIFNEATIKTGSFSISGNKESDMYTGVDVSYIEPSNSFKRETLRIDSADSNDGTQVSDIENIASIDLFGVTRRSQAMRMAQYHLAASKFQRRNVNFVTSIDAINLTPGDVIAISSQGTGIAYGFGGKISANSTIDVTGANTSIFLENYTSPSISSDLFTSNTKPITLRVINQASDRIELYVISNTEFTISNNMGISASAITVKALSKFSKTTNSFIPISTGFTANLVPKSGDLWSIGTTDSAINYYSSKAGKLFKVTGTKRDSDSEEISVSGVEYISNVYEDSDTFINYKPTSYTDIFSSFSTPPTPNFTFTASPRRKLDGTVVVDGIISTSTDISGYGQKFDTEYYVATPSATYLLANTIASSPLTFLVADTSSLSNGQAASIANKSGFSTSIGKIKLLCTDVSTAGGKIELTVEGLSSCIDLNYNTHVLGIQDTNNITLTIHGKTPSIAAKNFVGYSSDLMDITRVISSYDLTTNKIKISNDLSESGRRLRGTLPTAPFYISINQALATTNYSNNSFYVEGSTQTYIDTGNLIFSLQSIGLDLVLSGLNTVVLPIKPRDSSFVRFYVDGILAEDSSYTVNINQFSSLSANITYTAASSESVYRVEVDHYTAPVLEVGDKLEVSYANIFFVTGSSFDPTSPKYNASLTSNCIYRIDLNNTPTFNLSGSRFLNTSLNPTGTINNVTSTSFTLDYDKATYPGNFNLTNNKVYSLEVGSNYERKFLTQDSKIPELAIGTTSVKARNVNTIGRVSPYVQQSVFVSAIPIQKVTNLTITESIYIEQLAAAAIRITISFDHILNQDVTDYEISYKMGFKSSTDENTTDALSTFNTVKVPASGVDTSTGKISFTLNNVNRGTKDALNDITIKVTPLNKTIRGVEATLTQTIVGKTASPLNVENFIVGQQNDVITFSWSYKTNNGALVDLDLDSVEIRKIPGSVAATTANFNVGQTVVVVSAGSVRKSVPIDGYGTYTYLAQTKDTSGNISKDAVGVTITLIAAQRDTTVFAYSEDDPADNYSGIVNTNAGEGNFPSYNNVVTQGVKRAGSTKADNANASSSGWSFIPSFPDNILASGDAVYTTQIRDLGQPVTGNIRKTIYGYQEIQSTYTDQRSLIFSGTSIVSANATILRSTGIGTLLAGSTYSTVNKTLTKGANVWAIWHPGVSLSDTINTNSYALVAAVINANAIALGASYYANGNPTNSNALANVTTTIANFQVVDLKQYSDYTTTTFEGDAGAVSTQLFIRTSLNSPYYANGNVDSSVFSSTSDGFVPYEAGTRTMRYLQLKYVITNTKPNEYDFTLDKFKYNIDKEKTTYTNTVAYSAAPTTVDFSSAKFLSRPVINYAVLNQVDALANPVIVVTTASSNTSVSFQLVAAKTGTAYPTNSSANISITAIGV